MNENAKKTRNSILLVITATIWGLAFVAQSVGGKEAGAFTFNGIRSILGGIVLIPYILVTDRMAMKKAGNNSDNSELKDKKDRKTLIIGGILCGIFLCLAGNFQQVGLLYTSAGKAGFLTSCYILLVPVAGIFLKKKCPVKIWGCIITALVGLYYLCLAGNEDFAINSGDVMVIIAAVFFTFHILVIDYFSPKVDGVKMSCIQFFVCGIITCILMFIFEKPQPDVLMSVIYPLLYAGVLSCGVAYTLQIIGQRGLNPALASLIMSLEAVISAIGGFIILGEKMTKYEMIGCVLIFGAVIVAQLPPLKKHKSCC